VVTIDVFSGWPVEAVELYEGLAADNSRAYWHDHKAVYDRCVKAPMESLVVELGGGRIFRPNRDVRFSSDKSPYKLNCAAHLANGGYVSFSADGLFVGSGLYVPDASALRRLRAAIDDERSGGDLVAIVAALRRARYDVGAHDVLKTAPRGFAPDHPRIDLLRHKGLVMSKSWPVGAWLGTKKAKERVIGALEAGRPLREWLEHHVG